MTDFCDYLLTSSLRLGKIKLVPSTHAVCIFFLTGREGVYEVQSEGREAIGKKQKKVKFALQKYWKKYKTV